MRAPVACLWFAVAACASSAGRGNPAFASLSADRSTFHVDHSLTVPVPASAKEVRIWFPLPRKDAAQEVTDLRVQAPDGWREGTDQNGNRYVCVQVAGAAGGKVVVATSFTVARSEQGFTLDPDRTRALDATERQQYAAWLGSDRYVVIDDAIKAQAAQIAAGETNPVRIAHKLYDWTLANVEYWVKDPSRWKASPVGSSEYCLQNRTGNCTDFHSLYTALARACGIPTRMVYGSLFKPTLDGQDKDASYHCWPESFYPGIGWVPNDVAVADIYAGPIAIDANNKEKVELTTAVGYRGPDQRYVDYYFSNLDSRRVAWTLGRDLKLDPPQKGAPVNAIAKGYVEIDGVEFTGFERKMTYREVK